MKYPRRRFEMTENDMLKIVDASKPVTYIVVGGRPPSTPQENANRAWQDLGERMGFDFMTVAPTGEGNRIFTAVPTEPEADRLLRVERERREGIVAHIAQMEQDIKTLEEKIMSAKSDLASIKEL